MIKDPYNNIQRWESWRKKYYKEIPKGIKKEDWKILIDFLKDMELGINTPKEKKGKRDSGTLLNLSSHNQFFLRNFKKSLKKLTKEDLHLLEKEVGEGKIKTKNGKNFIAFGNYIKDFKVFWNWGLRTKVFEENIVEDISSKTDKPSWVYLTEEQVKKLFNDLKTEYRTYCWFLYDSGARVKEAINIKVSDFSKDFTQVTIREESAKTFSRTINLKLSVGLIKEFVKEHNLGDNDFLFIQIPNTINRVLKYKCGKLFGVGKISHPKSKGTYDKFTMYDIRHNSVCYWFNRYPTQKGIMYRFGWRKADKIEYYSEFLGVADEIKDSDMILGEDKTKLYKLEEENKKLAERIDQVERLIKQLAGKKVNDLFGEYNPEKLTSEQILERQISARNKALKMIKK